MVWLVPLFPLIGFLIAGIGRNKLGKASGWIASLAVLASFIVSCMLFGELYSMTGEEAMGHDKSAYVIHLFDFINTVRFHFFSDLAAGKSYNMPTFCL